MAQVGLWDLDDGQGLQPVGDPTVAQAILQKDNDLNVRTAVKAGIPAVIFAALPQSSSTALVLSGLAFAALYAVRDKIPSNP